VDMDLRLEQGGVPTRGVWLWLQSFPFCDKLVFLTFNSMTSRDDDLDDLPRVD